VWGCHLHHNRLPCCTVPQHGLHYGWLCLGPQCCGMELGLRWIVDMEESWLVVAA
jgi:hypothetical protein